VARATAHKIADALAERRPSPLSFARTTPQQLADGYRDYVANVQKLALRTRDRYKAALDRFLDFCRDAGITSAAAIALSRVEDFVKWLRGQPQRLGRRVARLLQGGRRAVRVERVPHGLQLGGQAADAAAVYREPVLLIPPRPAQGGRR